MSNLKNKQCIGPCYPNDYLYYNPITLQPVLNKKSSCPIEPTYKNNNKTELITIKKCDIVSENYMDNNIFDEFIQIANTPLIFLSQIYNIKNYTDVDNFINNDIFQSPILTQKRIINSIFLAYRSNSDFPNEIYINIFIKLFSDIYNVNLNVTKITKKIIKYKNNNNITDIFNHINNKII